MRDFPNSEPNTPKKIEYQPELVLADIKKYFTLYKDQFFAALNLENAAGETVEGFLNTHKEEIKSLNEEEKLKIKMSVMILQGFYYTTPSQLKKITEAEKNEKGAGEQIILEQNKEIQAQIRSVIKLISSK